MKLYELKSVLTFTAGKLLKLDKKTADRMTRFNKVKHIGNEIYRVISKLDLKAGTIAGIDDPDKHMVAELLPLDGKDLPAATPPAEDKKDGKEKPADGEGEKGGEKTETAEPTTVPLLKKALKALGIAIPSKAKKADLQKLYKDAQQ